MLDKDSSLTFTLNGGGYITAVNNNNITTDSCLRLPLSTELTFTKCNRPKINGRVSINSGGYKEVVITTILDDIYFGQEDVTYTLNPDLFITNTPNAYDQKIVISQNGTSYINFVRHDADLNKYDKTITITKNPSHGTLATTTSSKTSGTLSYYKTYTPAADFKGKDTIKFTAGDGVNTSEEKTIYLTIE